MDLQWEFSQKWKEDFLWTCVRDGNLNYIKTMFSKGVNIDYLDSEGNSLLSVAAKSGHKDVMLYFLKENASIFKAGSDGRSAIYWAIFRDHLEAVKLFLAKTNVNKADETGNTPLIYAAQEGRVSIAEFLLNRGADSAKNGSSGRAPLAEATIRGHLPLVKLLSSRGANVDKIGPDGDTALALAVRYKHPEIVEFLVLIMEADVCRVGNGGKPPLLWAVQNEDFDSIGLLLENGAEPTIQLALLEAISGGSFDVVKFLVAEGAAVDFVCKNGDTPLSRAMEVGNCDIIEYLKECGGAESDDEDWVMVEK